ncbi:phosphatidylserine/phosphatidylglycerophosphate/cardiolipin synthase family protein [Sphingomonas aliaeris]|uniref:Phospholipase D n=1 Tax=Sphingomonas aliaeris TaxID=2759526 RepID=A0A974S3Y2_9SPHN|nr:phosphatidylserine/phosphatidylglycerophosphate/cardiolipin synthase family protein [Sphingomonas aliaeris]QQV77038.1 phosphatidylserine/phosphatidylglycerophosphate/cardiolipin synthase family protein [Sphingomonas aliaeris]
MAEPPPQPSFLVDGDRLTMIDTGPRRLAALIALIDGARVSLRILYYIYVDDDAGVKVRQAMIDAAARGVRVSVIVDGMGSAPAASENFFEPLVAAGASVCRFEPRLGRRYLLRNHQKLALADGEQADASAIIGGFNIQDSYFGTPAEQAWRDLGLLVEGPSAAALTGYFDTLATWIRTPKAPIRALRRLLTQWSQHDGQTRWLLGGPTRHLSPWAKAVRADLRRARTFDLIAGYFAPNPAMLRRLDKVGQRGRVRIVLPSKNDHAAAIWASRFTYAGLLRKNVQIYEYLLTKLHTKLFVIDSVVYVGSANFDIRSMFLNLEIMLRIEDTAFADHARAYVEGEIAQSELITKALYKSRTTLWRRTKQAAAYFVIAVLDYNVTKRLNFGRERL